MALLIKKAQVYSPNNLGVADVLVVGSHIVAVAENLNINMPDLEILDASNLILTPGFIDNHIHVTGGGGEGGPKTRTPELVLSELVACGTTSVVAVSGTDSVTRSMEALLAKVRALNSEGVSVWMNTSNYALPPSLLSDSVRKDLFLVPEVIGVKLAMADHRASFITMDELMRLVSDIRVGGMLSGKIGFLHVHLGDLQGAFDMFNEAIERGIPIRHFKPTHCARNLKTFEDAMAFARKGGLLDITSGGSCFATPAKAVAQALEEGVPAENIGMSTDGHGSIPRFNDKKVMIGLGVGSVDANLKTFKALLEQGLSPEQAVPIVTSNPAKHYNLEGKGNICVGADADICLFDKSFTLRHVVAKGRVLMRDGDIEVKGTFEE